MAVLNWSDTTKVAPAREPVDVSEAKRNLGIDDDWFDQDLARWIVEAREKVEKEARVALITQQRTLTLDSFPPADTDYIELRKPANTVEQIDYIDNGGAVVNWPATEWTLDPTRSVVFRNHNKSWPNTLGGRSDVTIAYTAGFGLTGQDCPQAALAAIHFLLKHRFEQPNPMDSSTWSEIPETLSAVILQLRGGVYP